MAPPPDLPALGQGVDRVVVGVLAAQRQLVLGFHRGPVVLGWTNGVELPHDCRSGICGSCRVRLVEGKVFGGTEEGSDMIYACQARVVSDMKIVTEPVPETVSISARVAELVRLAPDVVGVCLELPKPMRYFPGQYCKLQFRGFPERSYSPSYPLEGAPDNHLMYFHIRKVDGGVVSSELGKKIRIGHRVKLTGPLGSAFLPGPSRRRAARCSSPAAPASRRCGRSRSPRSPSGRSASSPLSWRRASCSRSTCTTPCAGSPGFRTSPSFRSCPRRRTSPPSFARAGRPSTCRSSRRMTWSTPAAHLR